MSKKDFIKELEEELKDRDINSDSVEEILEDYSEIIDGALEKGEDEVSVLERIGRPWDIARTLSKIEAKGQIKEKVKRKGKSKDHKLVALSPFIATIIFFGLGYYYDMWAVSWMAFLLIPITGILSEMRSDFSGSIVGLSVFASTIAFFVLGFYYGLWHPGWLVFLIIPILGILTEIKDDFLGAFVGLTTFATIIFFILYGYYYDTWHPTWLVFFLIPLMTIVDRKKLSDKFITLVMYLFIPLVYLYLEYINFSDYNYLVFGFTILLGIYTGEVQIGIKVSNLRTKEGVTVIAIIIAYIALGIIYGAWHPGWLIFLLIPVMTMLYQNSRPPLVAFTPFIATAVFILLGHYFDMYAIAWLVFLIIPMAGIMTD